MRTGKILFTAEEISACTSREQLTELFSHAANKEALARIFRAFGLNVAGLEFCTKEKLAGYLAGELWILRQRNPLRQKVSLLSRLAGALERKCEDMALSLSGAALAGIMVFILAI